MVGVGICFCASCLLAFLAVGDAAMLFLPVFFPPFVVAAFAFTEDFGEADLKPAGEAFLLLFGGEVMDLVAGDFDFCFFVAGGVDLLIGTRCFFDDCCCYRQERVAVPY